MVRLFSPTRASALIRSGGLKIDDKLHALLAPLIDIDDAARGREERIDAHDVVAHVVDQLVVARR